MAAEVSVHSSMLEVFRLPEEWAPNSLLKGPHQLHVGSQ